MDHKHAEFLKQLNYDVRKDMYDMIEEYLHTFPDVGDEKNLLHVLGAMQAVLCSLYKEGLGPTETSAFFYQIADNLVADMVNKDLKKKNYKGPRI
jgi:hypothetical protein